MHHLPAPLSSAYEAPQAGTPMPLADCQRCCNLRLADREERGSALIDDHFMSSGSQPVRVEQDFLGHVRQHLGAGDVLMELTRFLGHPILG